MSFALVDYFQKGRFSNTRFVEASDPVDKIKAIKRAEEQGSRPAGGRNAGWPDARAIRLGRAGNE
jgi:hypothetical protein